MNEGFYVVEYCTFWGNFLADEELQDDLELGGYDEGDCLGSQRSRL